MEVENEVYLEMERFLSSYSHIHRSRRSSYGELSSEDMTNYLYLIDERKV